MAKIQMFHVLVPVFKTKGLDRPVAILDAVLMGKLGRGKKKAGGGRGRE